ncbi:MAG: quinoprotein relay system zinc metallohydrolase 2 [Rubrivivax sp.]
MSGSRCRRAGWVLLAAVALAACAGDPGGAAAPRAAAPLSLERVAAGVYVHRGAQQEFDGRNRGDVANVGFVVGERCVAVIDTGSTLEVGRRLLAAVRSVTTKPVCFVVNTHMHPDHVLGNAAFEGVDGGPVFVAQARLPGALAVRAGSYLRAVQREVGPPADGTRVLLPSRLVEQQDSLDLGGRRLVLRAWPTAHTDNDLTVWDEATRTLWTGDQLFVGRIPAIDGRLSGWLAACRELAQSPAEHVVPGHGDFHGAWREALARQVTYLEAVQAEVRGALKAGQTLPEMLAQDAAADATAARAAWALYDQYHRRNLTAAYAELEWE